MDKTTNVLRLNHWLQHLEKTELPGLSATIRRLVSVAEDAQSSAHHLAKAILPDPGVTAKLLRVANSVHFNPTATPVTTISRAIVLLGFDEMLRISLSVVFVDSLMRKSDNPLLKKRLAESLHAAVQAKNLAFDLDDEQREALFIATLLQHMGELIFLATSSDEREQYIENLDEDKRTTNGVVRRLLGFSFAELTQALAVEWNLSRLLSPPIESADRVIQIADHIAHSWHAGSDSRISRQLVTYAAAYTGLSLARARDLIEASARESAQMAEQYDLDTLQSYMPEGGVGDGLIDGEQDDTHQINYLHKISVLVKENASLHRVLQLITDAIQHSIGFGRVMVAMHNPLKTHLEVRYCLGDRLKEVQSRGLITIAGVEPDALSRVMSHSDCVWIQTSDSDSWRGRLAHFSQGGEGCCGPIEMNGEVVGIVYADQGRQAITAESFLAFQLFIEQLNMICSCLLARRQQSKRIAINSDASDGGDNNVWQQTSDSKQ